MPRDADGRPVPPVGRVLPAHRPRLPVRDGPLGRRRGPRGRSARCAGWRRPAQVPTCGNCGLVLNVSSRGRGPSRGSASRRRRDRLTVAAPRPGGAIAWPAASHYLYVVAGIAAGRRVRGARRAHDLLAGGRRLAVALAPRRAPAFAGVVGGSFVAGCHDVRTAAERRAGQRRGPVRDRPRLGRRRLPGIGALLLRGIVVGRGPWGNMFEFTVAFAFGDPRRVPLPGAPLPGPLDRASSRSGWRLGLFLYSWTLPRGDRGPRPGAPEPAAPDDPRRAGDDQLRDLRDELRGRGRLPRPGEAAWPTAARSTASAGFPRARSWTPSPTGPSSSASRSSPR